MPASMLKVAFIATGFWTDYQVTAWLEPEGVQIIAAFNGTILKQNPWQEILHSPGR